MSRRLVIALACLLVSACTPPAWAFRPFDLTDAAVAGPREMELECGPLGYIVDGDGRFVVAPAAILNFGLTRDWEIVIEGRSFFHLQDGTLRRHTWRDDALSVKHVLRRGSMQDRSGPSIGFEGGLLLPGVGIDSGVGASFGGLVSQRWGAFAVHVNGVVQLTREHRLAGVTGAIVEGPARRNVRPVLEFVFEQESRTVSGLVGAIWRVHDNLFVDAGWRIAGSRGEDQREVRAGFTWSMPLGSSAGSREWRFQ